MASLNKVLLIGNLTRAPEVRYTPGGTTVTDLRLAVNRSHTTQKGEKRDEVSFLTVVVWGKQAESCREYLDKGSQVFVEGRLQTRTWDGKDGQQRTVTEVVGERVQFMGRTKGAVPVAPAVDDAPADDDEPPFLTTEEIPPEKRRSRHESRTARSCTSASDAPRREP
jgi:single-strand DNA-binding protein